MNNDEIDQKLALLPEGLAEENLRTWQLALEAYQKLCSRSEYSQVLTPLFAWAKRFTQSEQAKLFRAGAPGLYLLISTKEKHGLEHGDPYVAIDVNDENLEMVMVSYFVSGTERNGAIESIVTKNNEIMSTLQLYLDRLWNETRGKKNA